MDPRPRQRSRSREPRRYAGAGRLPTIAAIGAFALALPASPAHAGQFNINACHADRVNYSTRAFEDFATRGMISPKGGVGKTTSTFLAGNLLASHLKLRVITVDASPGFGTLGRLPGEPTRSRRSLSDLLNDLDRLHSTAELRRYVSLLPSGLHVLAAPADPQVTANLGSDAYGDLLAFLACFYDVVLLDAGPGINGPLARFAIKRADHVVLVTEPDWIASSVAIDALGQLDPQRTTVVLNKATASTSSALPNRWVAIPHDERLALMLDSGTYSLEALDRGTRRAIKRLGLAVARQLI